MKRIWKHLPETVFVAMLVIAIVASFPLAAQDATDEPATPAPEVTPVPTPADPFPEVPPVEDLGLLVFSPIITIVLTLAGGTLGVAIINVLKQVPLFSALSGTSLKYLVGGVILAAILIARNFGYETQLDASLKFLQQFITIAGSLFATFRGMQTVYNQAVANEVPLLGYKRT
jgi:hypothetical protein